MKLTVQDVSNFSILQNLELIAGSGGLTKPVTHCGILDYEYDKDVSNKYSDYNYPVDGFLTLTSFLYAKTTQISYMTQSNDLWRKRAADLLLRTYLSFQ